MGAATWLALSFSPRLSLWLLRATFARFNLFSSKGLLRKWPISTRRNASMQTIPLVEQKVVLASLVGASGPFHAMTWHLSTAVLTPTPGLALTDMVEATFSGYAAQVAPALSGVMNAAGAGCQVQVETAPEIATGTPTAQTIQAWYATDAGVTVLLAYYPLAAPVPINNAGDAVTEQPFIFYGGQ